MRLLTLLATATLALALGASAARAEAPPSLADRFIPAYAGATELARLETLMRLQLAAGRWADAEATLDRLEPIYARLQPQRITALIPWRIFARAKAYEAGGVSPTPALKRAFDEIFASLPDDRFGFAYGWYGSNMDRLRDVQTQAFQACAGKPIDTCDKAADLLAARQSVLVWSYLLPASKPLLRAELERRFIVEDRLLVPGDDGARIAAVLIRPRAPKGKLTALLEFSIYASDSTGLSEAVEMAGHGYAGMVAWSRGKAWGEGGQPLPYEHDGADAAKVIDWLAAQPWSDGRVGMFSGSYAASTQWGALKHHPAALKAIATHASNAPGIDTPMQGNVFQSFVYAWPLYTTATPWLDELNYGDRARWEAVNRTWYLTGRPYRELDRIDGQPNPIFDRWLDHPAYDAFWRRYIPVGDEFASIDIPVFTETGYFDGGMVGALYYFQQHLAHRPTADHRMLIGPYHHFAMGQGPLANVNGYEADHAALIDLRALRLQWFDHVFRGAPLPEVLSGQVNFEVMGANAWRHVDSLSAMGPKPMRLFLTGNPANGQMAFADRPAKGPPPVLTIDFKDRSDVDYQVPASGLDARNSLIFTTAPLAVPTDVVGLFRGHFEIVANKRDLDLAVQFYEVRADGSYFPLHSYLGRASYMADRSKRRLLTPNRPQTLDFESQMLTARRIAPGSRIVATVGVPRQPEIQINYGTGKDVSDESIADATSPLRIEWKPNSWLEIRTGS
jgi:putative CocE/NonD family hydrolase